MNQQKSSKCSGGNLFNGLDVPMLSDFQKFSDINPYSVITLNSQTSVVCFIQSFATVQSLFHKVAMYVQPELEVIVFPAIKQTRSIF